MNVIQCFHRYACLVPAFLLLVGQAFSVSAQTVLIDFGNDQSFRGATSPSPDSKGNHWNSMRTGVFYQNLIDIQNNPTTIDFGFSTGVATDSYNGPAGPTEPIPGLPESNDPHFFVPFVDIDQNALGNMGGSLEAAFDYVAGPDIPGLNQVRFEIQQLDPAKKYELSFFGSHKYSTNATTVYTVFSDNSYTTPVGTASLNVQNPAPGQEGAHNRDQLATIGNLSPQTSNILYVQFIGSSGGLGYLNMLRITATTPVVEGDYNNNGTVDAADYVLWRKGGPLQNEVDTPGTVNDADYTAWRARFGNPGGGGSLGAGGSIPEPGALMLVAVGLAALTAVNRRR